MAIEPLQWKAWLRQEETQLFFEDLEAMRTDIAYAWSAGDFTHETASGTAMRNAKALGQVQMLDAILDLRTEKFMENG